MIFTEEELKTIDVDLSDEWMFPDYGKLTASVQLDVYDTIQKKACNFLGIDYNAVIEEGWIDVYADINVLTREVTSVLWIIVPNNTDICKGYEIDFEVNAIGYDGIEICRQLEQTNGVSEFLDECRAYVERGWGDE